MKKHNITRTLTADAVIAILQYLQRIKCAPFSINAILEVATEHFNIHTTSDTLLDTLRDLYRVGRVLHTRNRFGQYRFQLPEKISGLHWMQIKGHVGIFLDTRDTYLNTTRPPIVGWLNYQRGQFSARIVSKAVRLTQPIPTHITDLDDAVAWVLNNTHWVTGGNK